MSGAAPPAPSLPSLLSRQTTTQEQQPGSFSKSLNQVTIFPPPSLPLHAQQHFPAPPIPLLSCQLLLLPPTHPEAGRGGGRLQSHSCPAPAGLHMEPGLARDNSGGSGWILCHCVPAPWTGREHPGGLDREEELTHHCCCLQLNPTPYGAWREQLWSIPQPLPRSSQRQ